MDQNTINTVIVLRNDQTTVWESSKHIMFPGEVGIGYLENGNVIAKLGDGEHIWSELPQIEGVFEENQILTYNFGRHKTVNGKVDAGGKGMTTSQWLHDALYESLDPKTNYPTASLAAGTVRTDTGNFEIGSKITAFAWNGSHGNGSYVGNDGTGTYGTTGGTTNASGIGNSAFTWSVSNSINDSTGNTEDGTFTLESDKYIQIDDTSAKIYANLSATVTLDASGAYTPYNNLGQKYPAGKITGFDADGTTSKTFTNIGVKATGYRDSWYYVGTDCTTEIDSAFIRGCTSMGTSSPNFNIHSTTAVGTACASKCMQIPQGTKRIVFAVPGSKSKIEGFDVDGMGLPYDGFNKLTVSVKGANDFEATDYTVFVKENSNGLAATGYTVSIS